MAKKHDKPDDEKKPEPPPTHEPKADDKPPLLEHPEPAKVTVTCPHCHRDRPTDPDEPCPTCRTHPSGEMGGIADGAMLDGPTDFSGVIPVECVTLKGTLSGVIPVECVTLKGTLAVVQRDVGGFLELRNGWEVDTFLHVGGTDPFVALLVRYE